MRNRHPSPASLPDALDDEWRMLSTSPAAVELADEWHLIDRQVVTLDELLAATGYRPSFTARGPLDDASGLGREDAAMDEAEANVLLGRLVRCAGTDQLAARIVLQRILPGLRAAGRSWWRGCRAAGVEARDVMNELIGMSWEVISSYDVDRRPHHIAGNLIRETADRAFVRPTRRRAATDLRGEPATFDRLPVTAQVTPSDELVAVLGEAMDHRDVDAAVVGLLRDLVNADGSTTLVAERHEVTPRTIRTRRHHAIAHIRHLITDHAA